MNEDIGMVIMDPAERAKELLAAIELHASQKAGLIAELTAERAKIDAALVQLGAKRTRKRLGRPVGAKDKTARRRTTSQPPAPLEVA